MSDLTERLRHWQRYNDDAVRMTPAPAARLSDDLTAAADALEAAEAENDHLRHLLAHACKNLTSREVENDELHEDCVRLLTEKGAAEAKLAAIDALHRRAIFVGLCDYCARGWPCETYRILHHYSAEDSPEP